MVMGMCTFYGAMLKVYVYTDVPLYLISATVSSSHSTFSDEHNKYLIQAYSNNQIFYITHVKFIKPLVSFQRWTTLDIAWVGWPKDLCCLCKCEPAIFLACEANGEQCLLNKLNELKALQFDN